MTGQDATEVVPFLTSAATIVFVQKTLKTTRVYAAFVRAMPGAEKYAHWTVAGLASFVTAAGIHLTYNWNVEAGGTITFAVPGVLALVHAFTDWFKVFILQHTIYSATEQAPYVSPPKGSIT